MAKNKFQIAAFATAGVVAGALIAGVAALPERAATATSATQEINVTVAQTPVAIAIDSPAANADGGFSTKNSDFEMTLTVSGTGTIVIRDQNGEILWTFVKTTNGSETLTAPISLVGNPGEYVLTATMTSAGDPSETAVATLKVVYEATNLVPSPLPPNTGYVRVFGRAVSVNQIVSLVIYCAILSGIIWAIVAKKRKTQTAAETIAKNSRK